MYIYGFAYAFGRSEIPASGAAEELYICFDFSPSEGGWKISSGWSGGERVRVEDVVDREAGEGWAPLVVLVGVVVVVVVGVVLAVAVG